MSTIWHPVARIIRAYLVEQGVGVNFADSGDWQIATAACPDKPANMITIYDEAAIKKGRTVGCGVVEDPVVLIEVRSQKHQPGQYKAKQIQEAMDALSFWEWVGTTSEYSQTVVFATARRMRGIFPLGTDDKGNYKFNLEYALVVQSIKDYAGDMFWPENLWPENHWADVHWV